MNAITNHDIRDHVVEPYLGEFVADYDVEAIVSELLDQYPLSEWFYGDLVYSHPEFDSEVLEQIARHHDISGYDMTRQGLAPLALDWDLEQRLATLWRDVERGTAIEEKINERVSAKIREHGRDYDGTWLGAWSAQDIVREVLDEEA